MSSPIAIPRPVSVDATRPSSPSSTSSSAGKYIPVHKRAGATLTPESPSSSRSRSSSPPRQQRRGKHMRPVADYEHNHNEIPIHTSVPNIYSISDLLNLSTTAVARLSPSQMTNLHDLLTFTYVPSAQPAGAQPQRRRRTNRATKTPKSPRPIANAPEDVHEQRRRHAAWGWHPVAHLDEAWRHPVVV